MNHGSFAGAEFKLKKHGNRKKEVNYWMRAWRRDDTIDRTNSSYQIQDDAVVVKNGTCYMTVLIGKYNHESTLRETKEIFVNEWYSVNKNTNLQDFKKEMAMRKVRKFIDS